MLKPLFSLIIIAGICASLLALTQTLTGERIEDNVRERELQLIIDLAGTTPATTGSWTGDVWNLCNGTVLARTKVAGYGGPIALVIALTAALDEGRLRGLRITRHQETPGLADFLGQPEQGWLAELPRRDSAQLSKIDTVAGATITSRAVLRGVLQARALAQEQAQTPEGCTS
jgi:electron transport complex protein RnfG